MDDRDFFDLLYQQWVKTTDAETTYWMPEPFEDHSGRYRIYAVSEDESRKLIASGLAEIDADFLTAVHGCFGDLVKRLHSAVDEADRLDLEKDDLVNRVGALELEADDLNAVITHKEEQISELQTKLSDERGYSSYLQCDINDLQSELKSERADAQMWRSAQGMFVDSPTVYPFGRQP